MTTPETSPTSAWPALRVDEWTATRDTLHMWTQIVGKVRLVHTSLVNHWWNVALYVTARGLTTSAIPLGSRVSTSSSTSATNGCASVPATATVARSLSSRNR
jgi:hypothetical protein